jgi:hypothetical protein
MEQSPQLLDGKRNREATPTPNNNDKARSKTDKDTVEDVDDTVQK